MEHVICILSRMQIFFKNKEAIEQFLKGLSEVICPDCGSVGTLTRHGYIWGNISPTEYGIRGWRLFCDPDSCRGQGCGKAPSIRLSTTLPRRCFSTIALGKFTEALLQGLSVRAAWKYSGIGLSVRTAYRLFRRLWLCQSILRVHLHNRAPPPERKGAGSPLLKVLTDLKSTFISSCFVTAYQESFQRDFLAMA